MEYAQDSRGMLRKCCIIALKIIPRKNTEIESHKYTHHYQHKSTAAPE